MSSACDIVSSTQLTGFGQLGPTVCVDDQRRTLDFSSNSRRSLEATTWIGGEQLLPDLMQIPAFGAKAGYAHLGMRTFVVYLVVLKDTLD